MSKKYTQDTIELYLKKQLQGLELEAFESAMKLDPAFKKEVETQQLLFRAANKAGEDEMRARLKKIRAEVLENTTEASATKVVSIGKRENPNTLFRWSIAAAVIIALGAALYWLAPERSSPEELFASYYEPYSEEITVRGDGNEALINQASQSYQNGDFQAALPLYQQILNSDENNAEIRLVIGICHLELSQYPAAIESFKSINNPLYRDQAQWYLAMTYLKSGDLNRSKTILKEIPDGAFNYSKAQQILGED